MQQVMSAALHHEERAETPLGDDTYYREIERYHTVHPQVRQETCTIPITVMICRHINHMTCTLPVSPYPVFAWLPRMNASCVSVRSLRLLQSWFLRCPVCMPQVIELLNSVRTVLQPLANAQEATLPKEVGVPSIITTIEYKIGRAHV